MAASMWIPDHSDPGSIKCCELDWTVDDGILTGGQILQCMCFRSVVVITFASHAKGPRFETGRKQYYIFEIYKVNV